MSAESERLIHLVHDLLALARADAQAPRRPERVALGPLVEDVCRQARLLDRHRSVVCDEIPDVDILGEGEAIRRVLLALIDNAIRHAHGPIHVTCEATAERVALSVRDGGPGIASEDLERIFERFYRGKSADSGAGSGLGLAIAKALTEAQHGSIQIQSKVGVGSVFTVTLPRPRATETIPDL